MTVMSGEEACRLAYEGKLEELRKAIEDNPALATIKDQGQRQPIHWACSGGQDMVLYYLVNSHNASIHEADDAGWTPLIIAASAGRDQIVENLLRQYADVNHVTSTGHTALLYAASKNRFNIAKLLIDAGADVNVQEQTTGASPLHRAASLGHMKIATLLLDNKAKVNAQDKQGNTPLHLACEEERTELAELLNYNDASLTILNSEKKSPLDLSPPFLVRRLKGD